MINKKLFTTWQKQRRTSRQAIYQRIESFRKGRHFTVTKEEAAYFLAAKDGIDIGKYLSREEYNQFRGSPVIAGVNAPQTVNPTPQAKGKSSASRNEEDRPIRRAPIAPDSSDEITKEVRSRLGELNSDLQDAYTQVMRDLQDSKRLSFRSTGNEMREILRDVLFILAPDQKVMDEPGYTHEEGQNGPTRRQRLKYIFSRKGGDSELDSVDAGISVIEGGVTKLTLIIYKRSNRATHTSRARGEAKRLFSYLNPILSDLLAKD